MAKVLSVDFKAKSNAAKHNCEKYEIVSLKEGTPVLRRGGTFSITLRLNREVDIKKEYILRLFFNFGEYSERGCYSFSDQPNSNSGLVVTRHWYHKQKNLVVQ